MAACLGNPLPEGRIAFDLKADEFPRAILEFYRQSHVQVIFSSVQDLRSIRTQPVVGELDPAEALQQMLRGTPLTFAFDSDHSVIIRHAEPAQPDSAAPPPVRTLEVSGPEPLPRGPPVAVKVDEVRVTGSLIPRSLQSPAPLITVTPHDMGLAAYPSVEDALYQLPINSLNAPRQDLGLNANFNWGTGLDLRGLGVGATLVLVDGQRQPLSGYNGDFVDVSNIPAALVERIEVLPDGASALYGSDAIAGVVNIIMRRELEGAQTSAYVGVAPGGRHERLASQIAGFNWSGGRLLMGYEYWDTTPLDASARSYAADADKTPLGGGNYRSYYTSPGNLINPATSQPEASGLQNPFTQYELFPEQRQHSVYASLSQAVGEGVQVSASARFTRRDSLSRQLPYQQLLEVPRSNPYYESVGGGTGPMLVAYSFQSSLGATRLAGQTDNYDATLGADSGLGRGWHAALTATVGREQLLARSYDLPDQGALREALASPDPAVAFDPFGTNSAATLAAIQGEFVSHAASSVLASSLILDGPLLNLPSGALRLAVGVERRQEVLRHDVPDPDNPMEASVPQRYSRSIDAAFTEVSVPLVPGAAFEDPRLQLTMAGRYEHYSDFGQTFSPTARLTWVVSPFIKLRASGGRSFRAPTLSDLYDSAGNGAGFAVLRDPLSPTGQSLVLLRRGDNPGLKEETATTWTGGLDLAPGFLAGGRLSLTYYSIRYQNQIATPAPADPFGILLNESQWSSVINRNPTAQQIAAICMAPGMLVGSRSQCLGSAPAAIIDMRLANLSSTRVSGLDLTAHQRLDSPIGPLGIGVTGTYYLYFDQSATSSQPGTDVLGTVGNPMALRLRSSLEWHPRADNQGLGALLAFNYTSGYRDPGSLAVPDVSPFNSVDLQVSYRTGETGWWSRMEMRLNVVNLLNRCPPFVDDEYGYDRFNMQPLGRVTGLTVRKSW